MICDKVHKHLTLNISLLALDLRDTLKYGSMPFYNMRFRFKVHAPTIVVTSATKYVDLGLISTSSWANLKPKRTYLAKA